MYGFSYNGQFYFYQHGFDDRYRNHSIGLVLMALTIRAAIDEGAHTFDMLWGTEPYKWLWASDERKLNQIRAFPAHVGGCCITVSYRSAPTARPAGPPRAVPWSPNVKSSLQSSWGSGR